jgi:hypothetical protein
MSVRMAFKGPGSLKCKGTKDLEMQWGILLLHEVYQSVASLSFCTG